MISVTMKAALSAPRSYPANSHDFLPSAKPLSARSLGGVVRQANPAVVQEGSEAIPTLEHVVDRLYDRRTARKFCPLGLERKPTVKAVLR